MKRIRLLPEGAIVLDNYEDAAKVMEVLVRNENAVLLTLEDQYYVINYTFCVNSDRNNIVFMDRETFEVYFEEVEREGDE